MKDTTIIDAYLHVQTSNEDAKQFYIAHGFEETETIMNYYKRIEPPGKNDMVFMVSIHEICLYTSANVVFTLLFIHLKDCYVLKRRLREVS